MLKAFRSTAIALLAGLIWATQAAANVEDLPPPERVVESVFDEAVDALLEHESAIREDPRIAYELIDEILSPHVHFDLTTRLILGRYVRDATDEQRERFISAFRETIIRTYSRMLSDNIDAVARVVRDDRQLVDIEPATQPDDRGRVTVRTRLNVENSPIPVVYRMIATDEGWRVYDVVIENISFVTNFRQEYGSEINRGGLDGLIDRLEERNRQARSG